MHEMNGKQEQEDSRMYRLRQVVFEIAEIANYMAYSPKQGGEVMSKAVQYHHRTIQQVIIATMVNAIIHYAESASTDGRNEAAKALAEEVRDGIQDSRFFYQGRVHLPFI